MHRVVREANGRVGVGEHLQGALLARICVDRRGLWLQVANGMPGVHVNGRPIRRMALLRAGDAIYVDGVELMIRAAEPAVAATAEVMKLPLASDPRIVLRGVGGPYHGRSIPMDRPCLVGRHREAGIRIDDPAFDERHASLELHGERLLLRDLSSAEGTWVNGRQVRDALLRPGDQLAFDAQHRFVVEVPWGQPHRITLPAESATANDDVADGLSDNPAPRRSAQRWPWLLLAAAALAAALSALLLFGAR